MSAGEEALPNGNTSSEAAQQDAETIIIEPDSPPPVVTRRTRSGRVVRTPSALLDSQTVKTPARRPRRSTVKELPEPEEKTDVEGDTCVVPAVENSESTEPKESIPSTESNSIEVPLCPEPAESTEEPNENNRGTVRSPTRMEMPPACSDKTTAKKRKHSESEAKHQDPVIPLGKPKSGRVWKDRNKQRFSAMVQDKPLRSSWEKKMAAKRDRDLVKKFSQQLKDDKAREKEDKRKRREENLKRRAENERKAEIVQVIQNTTKIKRIKKKQLRKIEKRDTLALLQKSQLKMAKAKPNGRPSKSQTKAETIA